MRKIAFNDGWTCRHAGDSGKGKPVTIPHDAMLDEKRTQESLGGINIGWFEGFDYVYEKEFSVPQEYEDFRLVFEFEGVYRNAEVYLNGKRAGFRPYGYTNFYVEANEFLHFGMKNQIQVIARNADQPNSRWYSGAGIYRPVSLYMLPKKHIGINGVKISTVSIHPAVIDVKVETSASGELELEIFEGESLVSGQEPVASVKKSADGNFQMQLEIPNAKLWSTESPFLYTCRVRFEADEIEEVFGIRKIEWSAENGFLMNGNRVILRGACIHHDNGVLGACCYPEAEERKIRILKENGYNAIRSAHNPCSKALLDACDRQGMLVMDEFVDVWYIHKTEYDYVNHFAKWWKQDLKDMVEKDYNHPSVILYSTGNEVSETAQERGIRLTGQMTEYLHSLDATRPVTCGINIFFNFLSSIMDVEMKFMDGMSAAEEIRKMDTEVVIIFITNMPQYAIQGYRVDALDYVLKPVSYFAFTQRIDRALTRLKKREKKYLTIAVKGGMMKLDLSEICYVEVQDHDLIYHTVGQDYRTKGTMRDAEESLADGMKEERFFRCNRCYLVNLDFVENFQGSDITVNGDCIQVSRARKKAFLNALNDFMNEVGK